MAFLLFPPVSIFRCRSRSMSDFNLTPPDSDTFYSLVPLPPITHTPYSPTSIISTPSPTLLPVAATSPYDAFTHQLEPCDAVMRPREPYDAVTHQCHRREPYGQTANESAFPFVLRRNLSKRMASGSEFVPTSGSNRGSFYMSGTMSESTSRDGSPTRSAAFVRRQLSPYPVAPPSMIITPVSDPDESRVGGPQRGLDSSGSGGHGTTEEQARKLQIHERVTNLESRGSGERTSSLPFRTCNDVRHRPSS